MTNVISLPIYGSPMAGYIKTARYIKKEQGHVKWNLYLRRQVPDQLRRQVQENS